MAKQKWTVKNNFEDMINFLSDIGVEDIKLHIENAPQNAIYTSTTSAKNFLKAIGDYLNEQLVTDVLAAGEFSVLADESMDGGRPFTDSSIYSFCERYFTQSSRKVFGGA